MKKIGSKTDANKKVIHLQQQDVLLDEIGMFGNLDDPMSAEEIALVQCAERYAHHKTDMDMLEDRGKL